MTKERNAYPYHLVGFIQAKKRHPRKLGFNLTVQLKNQTITIQAFWAKLKNETIWETLESNQYLNKNYLFICQNYFGKYHLINWRELSAKELKDYGSN